jgi:hypothetical protein
MNNQEILDNAPECATHVDHLYLYWMVQDRDAFNWQGTGWQLISSDAEDFRSLSDIKRIVELEKDLNTAESIIIKTANNIIEADNCEQDSDEMNECWDCLKEFALLATGRCDT